MNHQDYTQMPATGEDQDDAELEINAWSAVGAVLLGLGFVFHMTFGGIGDGPTAGLYWRLHFFFVLMGGVAITAIALAALSRMKKPKTESRAAQHLA
jgi:hypothetical protein